jgi:hypothetical protein
MLYFYSFGEFIHHYEDVSESSFGFLKWIYQIQPPSRERPGDRYGLELMGRHILLSSKKNWQPLQHRTKELASNMAVDQ